MKNKINENNYWNKENVRKRLREKSKENLVKRKYEQFISNNIIKCILSFLCCCLILFNFSNSKTMLALICVLIIGFIMIVLSTDIIKISNKWFIVLNMIISMMLAVIFMCNQQEIDATEWGYYDTYYYKVVIDQCINVAIVTAHSLFVCRYKYWYLFLGFNIVNLAALYFSLSLILIITSIILILMFVSLNIYINRHRSGNE